MKKTVFFLCLVIASLYTFAQDKYEEVVYLKNGTIVHGMIIEYVPNMSIKIKSGPNVFAYKLDEIDKITREGVTSSTTGFTKNYGFKKRGYAGIVEVGLNYFPVRRTDAPGVAINIINGFQFNPIVNLGAGVGVDISGEGVIGIPVTLDFRANFIKTRVTPFFAMGVGYYMQFGGYSSKLGHGFVSNPSFGVRFAINTKVAVSLSIGHKLTGVDYSHGGFNVENAFCLKTGIYF
jgi:hypothetical protein